MIHGAGAPPRNAGDDAQAFAAAERLEKLIPGCEVLLAKIYADDDGSLWPGRAQVPSPHLYLLGLGWLAAFAVKHLRRMSLAGLAALLCHLCLVTRAVRLLCAAKIAKTLGLVPLIDSKGRHAIKIMRDCNAVYCSGGGNLNDLWLRQELFPRVVTYRLAHLLGKPVFVSGQGVGPLHSRLGQRLLRWGVNYVKIFACRDKEESVAQMRAMGVSPAIVQALGDDATDLRSAGRARGEEILRSEGAPVGRAPLVAVHVRLTNFSTDFRETGRPFMASLCDGLVEKLGCHVVFIPITHSRPQSCDQDIGDAVEVFARMTRRDRAVFVCRERYSPPEIKALISCCTGLVGFSYHSWVFALTSGRPAFGLFHGEYFRKKAAGLFEWYDHSDWAWDINQVSASRIIETMAAVLKDGAPYATSLESKTRALITTVEQPARSLSEWLSRDQGGLQVYAKNAPIKALLLQAPD